MEIFRRYGFDKPLAGLMLILSILGIVMVFSSSAVPASEKYKQTFYFFINQILGVVVGMGLIFWLISLKRPFYQNQYLVYGLTAVTLGLLVLCFLMPSHANTNRWVEFAGIRFQPSELAKISLVLFLAFYFEKKKEKLDDIKTLLFPVSVLMFFVLLILKEPDYGTAMLVFGACAGLFFLAGVKARHLLSLGAIFGILFAFYLFSAQYRRDRLNEFISPEKDPLGKSFQVIQSKIAVGSGGLLGVSLGESTQKLYFLPYAHTDFIYAIIGEELGLLGTVITLSLFLGLLWRGVVITLRAPCYSAQLVAAGLTLFIGLQAFYNISVVLGIGPAKGVPLPLISFGRSSLICNYLAIGILLNLSQRKSLNGIVR